MRDVKVRLNRNRVIGDTDRRLFGAFVEHLGRCIYGGTFRAGPSDGDAEGVPRRCARARARARADDHALSRRQLRLRLQLGGRGRPGREAPGAHGARLAVARAEHLRHQRVHRLVPARGHRADARRQSRHARTRRRSPARRILQPPVRHRALRPPPRARLGGAARRQVLVPRQRGRRPLADGQQDRRPNTAASPPRRRS